MDIPMNKTYIESDFPDWTELEQLRYNNYKPAYKERKIQKIALEWLPYSPSETPFGGGWHWGFCVSMEQEKRWNFIEFREGFEYGQPVLIHAIAIRTRITNIRDDVVGIVDIYGG